MKHGLVLTVLAKERYVFSEIHVLEVISNKASITALDTLAEFLNYFFLIRHSSIDGKPEATERRQPAGVRAKARENKSLVEF